MLHAGITKPLGLTDTIYGATEPIPADVADAYHVIQGAPVNVSTINLSAYGSAAAIISTTQDLGRFIDALLGGDLMKPATLDEMLTFGPSDHAGYDAGLGIVQWTTPGGRAHRSLRRWPRLLRPHVSTRRGRPHHRDARQLGGDEEPVDATYFDAIQMAVASAAPGS